jgi:agarase
MLGVACLAPLLLWLSFGGQTRAPTGSAKHSFFRVEKRDASWTFVDTQGQKFLSLGINFLRPAEEETVEPPRYDGLARHKGSLEKWRAFTLERLRAWNFNTIGAWSSLRGRPYVLEFSLSHSWIDVFGDDFEKYVRQAAQNALKRPDIASDFATLAKDPLLIGYFTDNELFWGWDYSWTGKDSDLSLFEYYATLEPDAPGKKIWAAYLAGTCRGDFKQMRQLWNVEAGAEKDLLAVKQIAPRAPEHHEEAARVADGFLLMVAERYFEVTSRVMRGHLPQHLNLGPRLQPRFPTAVAETAGRYVDVLSFNVYERDIDYIQAEVTRLYKAGKKPVLVSEFSFVARENRSGNTNEGYEQVEVRDDGERGRQYARCVEALSELPFVIGCHWFQYFDQPTNGRADGESCNFGLVDLEDRVYEDLARRVTAANARALNRRGTSPTTLKEVARLTGRRSSDQWFPRQLLEIEQFADPSPRLLYASPHRALRRWCSRS